MIREKIKIGRNPKIAPNVVIGYKSLRKTMKAGTVLIGDNPILLTGAVIYEDVVLGDNAIIGHNVVIREENNIGNNFNIWNNSVVDYGCKIGNNVKIHCNVYIAQFTEIEDEVFIGPGVVTANDIHPGCKFSKECMKGPLIKKGAKIGANVTLNPFISIGKNSLIGSGSVVTKDIPDDCVAYGKPAEVKKKINALTCITGITQYPYK